MPTATIYPQRDSWMNAQAVDTNYGAATFVEIGITYLGGQKNKLARSLLNFDVSSLATYVIDAAKLVRQYSNVLGGGWPATCYRCTRPSTWTEPGVTWNKYDGSNSWTAIGGDYDSQVPAPKQYTEAASYGVEHTLSGLREFVVDAILNRSSIVSLLLRNDDEGTPSIHWGQFISKENGSYLSAARLAVDYTVPPPAAPGRRGELAGYGERRPRAPLAPSSGRRPPNPSRGRNT